MSIDYKTPEDVKAEKEQAANQKAYEASLTTVEVKKPPLASFWNKPEKKMEDPRAGVRGQKGYAKGGTASARADGIAQRGKTKGTFIMCGGGMAKK
jgi:hypothetical protein